MKDAFLEVNKYGKFKFFGTQEDFAMIIMFALKTFDNNTKTTCSKDNRLCLYRCLISFINDNINKIERN